MWYVSANHINHAPQNSPATANVASYSTATVGPKVDQFIRSENA